MKKNPLVSIIIPVYNGESTIERAINGIKNQTYTNYEIIVIDDESTDTTVDVLSRFKSEILIIKQKNTGCVGARQTGLKHANGEYIAFLDQDDWWIPEKLKLQVNILNKKPKIGLTFGNLKAVTEDGKHLGFYVNPPNCCHAPTWEELLLVHPVYPSTVMARRELINEINGFDVDFGVAGAYGDQDFHLRLREITNFHFLNKSLGYYYWDEARPQRIERFLKNLQIYAIKYWNHHLLLNSTSLKHKFAQKLADEIRYSFRKLLEFNNNIADFQLLSHLNNYNKQMAELLGKEYINSVGMNWMDLSKYKSDNSLSTLLFIYLSRPGAHKTFPEVFRREFNRLLEWGIKVSDGTYKDIDHHILSPLYSNLYELSNKTRNEVITKNIIEVWKEFGTDNEKCDDTTSITHSQNKLYWQFYNDHLELIEIKKSVGYRFIKYYSSIIERLLPDGTRRENFKKIIVVSIQMIANNGFKNWYRALIQKIKDRDYIVRG